MFFLITGGASCGKSAYAERVAASLPGARIYLATLQATDAESLTRIAKHRAARDGRGFRTVERGKNLAALSVPADATVLLECLGNLLANEMFDEAGGGARAALAGVRALGKRCRHLIVVTNEVGAGGLGYGEETVRFLRELGSINCILAAEADAVCEMVCGVRNILKGEVPCLP